MRKVEIVDYGLQFGDLTARTITDAIVIHHTGNPVDDDLSAEQLHRSHINQGWSGIGYHYVVRKDGKIEQGRPHQMIGSHAYRHNGHTLGIHLCGNFVIGQPTSEQVESAALLIGKLCEDYGFPVDKSHVVGHCDLMATACPGVNLYAILQTIRGKALWYQQN